MESFFQDILDPMFGHLLIHLEKVVCYFVHSEDHNFKTLSLSFEKENMISFDTPQEKSYDSLLSSESNDKPFVSESFESFLDQKAQIPILFRIVILVHQLGMKLMCQFL
jgi:hypothetical protein